jgi:signal transduction histidine kinase
MEKKSLEKKSLMVLSVLFVLALAGAWVFAMNVKKNISASVSGERVDTQALVTDVEKLRHVAEAQLDHSLQFFLMGASSIFDEQKQEKAEYSQALEDFQKKYQLVGVADIIKKLQDIQTQQQDFFDQGMQFREKREESKIIGQFYRSKTRPLLTQINKNLNEIIALHKAEIAKNKDMAKSAAQIAEERIPELMRGLTAATVLLFAGLVFLIIKLLRERSRHYAERTRLYEEAQKAVLARDQIAAAIAMDLKAPLEQITHTAEDMKAARDVNQVQGCIDLVQSSAAMIDAGIKDILDEAKTSNGQLTLRLDQLGVDTVLDEARLMMAPVAKQKDIRLEFNSVNPPALAFMDRERVLRVMANLVGNAIKFSPRNTRVSVKVKSDTQFVYISVKDSGPGIPAAEQSELFTHFWQARKTADQGAGVGLAVVKSIVEAHGGTVTVESHDGNGSTFTFSLPKRRPAGAHIGKSMAANVKITNPRIHSEWSEGPGL